MKRQENPLTLNFQNAELIRCAIQLSAMHHPVSINEEKSNLSRFLFDGNAAVECPCEFAWALIYRMATSVADSDDRIGCWYLLVSLLELIIEHAAGSIEELTTDKHDEQTVGLATIVDILTSKWNDRCLMIDLVRSCWPEARSSPTVNALNYALRSLLSSEILLAMDDAWATPPLSPPPSHLLPSEFVQDALVKLQRDEPRPSTVVLIARMFLEETSRRQIPWPELKSRIGMCVTSTFSSEISASNLPVWIRHYNGMHPRARLWLSQLATVQPSLLADAWDVPESQCPCEQSYVDRIPSIPTHMAQAILEEVGIENVWELTVLDELVERIAARKKSWEKLLLAIDTRRGTKSCESVRSALFLLSSYRGLRASSFVSGDESDSEQLREHLVGKQHRLSEFVALENARLILRAEWLGELASQHEAAINVIREKRLPLFTLLGFSPWQLSPEQTSIFSKELRDQPVTDNALSSQRVTPNHIILRRLAPLLCRHCLKPRHTSLTCSERYGEPWDIQCAIELCRKHGMIDEDASLFALHPQDILEKTLDSLEDEQALVRVALSIIKQLPLCPRCGSHGHSPDRCESFLFELLRHYRIHPALAVLDKNIAHRCATAASAELDPQKCRQLQLDLQAAIALLREQHHVSEVFAEAFAAWISIPEPHCSVLSLSAARYLPSRTRQYVRAAGLERLVQAVDLIESPGFPPPCLFTGRVDVTEVPLNNNATHLDPLALSLEAEVVRRDEAEGIYPLNVLLQYLTQTHQLSFDTFLQRRSERAKRVWEIFTKPNPLVDADVLEGFQQVRFQLNLLASRLRVSVVNGTCHVNSLFEMDAQKLSTCVVKQSKRKRESFAEV